jgi:uncharacterized protein (TIGR03067 family)
MRKTLRNLSFMVLVALMLGATTTGCGKKPSATPSDNKPGDTATPTSNPSTGSDLERLQGVWVIENLEEASDGKKGRPEEEKMREEIKTEMKKMRFQIQGNKMSVLIFGEWQNATFKLDEKANPKVMIVTDLDDKGEPKKRLGKDFKPTSETRINEDIYKFEGDLLVIAHNDDPGLGAPPPRPTEFKARAAKFKAGTMQPEAFGVSVITLKKTNEPFKDTTPAKPKNTGITPAPTGKTGTARK